MARSLCGRAPASRRQTIQRAAHRMYTLHPNHEVTTTLVQRNDLSRRLLNTRRICRPLLLRKSFQMARCGSLSQVLTMPLDSTTRRAATEALDFFRSLLGGVA